MECGCPLCSELARTLKKVERRLSEECRWNLAQGQYCVQLEQDMQRDKELWQREETKLRENLRDLNDKLESLYKNIQEQHKQQAHLEFKNEVLEDQKQELQDKVAMLQDKVKSLCAEMSRAQHRARMLEEKLTAVSKILEESQMLKARVSQVESQKARLESKVNRLQEEKQQTQDELSHIREENCQMQIQLIEMQQKLLCLDTGMQQMQVHHPQQKESDTGLVRCRLKDSNWDSREDNDFTTHENGRSAFNEVQVLTKELEYRDSNITKFQNNNCILKWQQQTAFHNGGAAAVHVTEICTMAPIDAADKAIGCCDIDLQCTEDCVENKGKKSAYSTNTDSQKGLLSDEKRVCGANTFHNNGAAAIHQVTETCKLAPMDVVDNHKEYCDQDHQCTEDCVENKSLCSTNKDSQRAIFLDGERSVSIKTALHNDVATAVHQITETCTLAPTDAADKVIECCDLDVECTEDCAEDDSKKCPCSINNNDSHRTAFLDEAESASVSELKNSNTSSPCRNEIQTTVCMENVEDIKKSPHIIKISENEGNLGDNSISSSSAPNLEYVGKNYTEMSICKNTAKRTHAKFTDRAENPNIDYHREDSTYKDQLLNSPSTESESSAVSDAEMKQTNALHDPSHGEKAKHINKQIKSNCCYEEKQTDDQTIHPRSSFYRACTSKSEECCYTISEQCEQNKGKHEHGFTHNKIESMGEHHLTDVNSKTLVNAKTVWNTIINYSPVEIKECNCADNGSAHTKVISQSEKNIQTKNEDGMIKTMTLKCEDYHPGHPNSERDNMSNKNKGSLSILSKKTDNKTESQLVNKKNKPQCNIHGQIEKETKFIEASKECKLSSEKSSQKVPPKLNEGSSSSEKISQRESPRSNGLNKGKGKLSYLSKKCKNMGKTQRCIENTYAENASESLNNNSNNIVHKSNTWLCSKNPQTEHENVTIQCETRYKRNVNPGKALETIYKGTCRLKKLNVSFENNNNVDTNAAKQRKVPQCNKNIQTENGIQLLAMNESTTVDGSSINQENTVECSKDGREICALNKNKEAINDNIVCRKITSQHNRDTHSENEIDLNKSTDNKLTCKKKILECNKDIPNGNQSSALYKNNSTCEGLVHKNTSDHNAIPLVSLSERNLDLQHDKLQQLNISQCNKHVQSQTEVRHIALNENCIVDDNLAENIIQCHPDTHSKNRIQVMALKECSNTVVHDRIDKMNKSQPNKAICNENETLSVDLNKNNSTTDDDLHRKNNTQWNKNVQNQHVIHPISLNKSVTDKHLAYRKNIQQHDKFKEIENGTKPIATYKTGGFVTDDNLMYKNTTQCNGCPQNQTEIQIDVGNNSENIVHDDLMYKNNTLRCDKDHETENGSHPSVLELEVLHEANSHMSDCNTSSSEMCNNMVDCGVSATKTFTKVNPLNSSEEIGLVSAVREGKFSDVEELLSLGTCPNCAYNGNTPLHVAAQTGNVCICSLLLEAGARADARNCCSGTPLHAAAKCGNLEVGKLLVRWGVSIEHRDKAGNLASDIAINNGHFSMYNWLQAHASCQEQ